MDSSLTLKATAEARLGRVDILVSPDLPNSSRPVRRKPWWRSLVAYGALVALCLLVMTWRLKLWRADPAMPLTYGGDAFLHQLWVKGLIENGWYLHNPALGMPFGMDSHDYPQSESLHLFLMKLLACLRPDYAFVFNAYCLLTFPLVAVAAFAALRRLALSRAAALAASLLYTFLPFHINRLGLHPYLIAYYLVPPLLMVAIWLYLDEDFLVGRDSRQGKTRWRFGNGKALTGLGIGALVACAGVYYAFFSCYLLLAAGIAAAWRRRGYQPLLAAAVLIGVIGGGVLVNLVPNFLYYRQHGTNPVAVRRHPKEAEMYGLKIAQLLLPASGHRFAPLAHLGQNYSSTAPLVNENMDGTLGIVGGSGLVLLLAWVLLRRPGAAGATVLDAAGYLNLALVLLATVGGFASVFSYLGCSWVRGYNRVSVFIAFLAFFAFFHLLDQWGRRRTTRLARLAFPALLGGVLLFGLWDEAVAIGPVPGQYDRVAKEFRNDEAFVRAVETQVPAGAMILQLPPMSFYEHLPIHQMYDYDHLRGYLHSRQLRWSYGAIEGRAAHAWQDHVASQPPAEMVRTLCLAGFRGIYIDRNGYADRGAALETALGTLLQSQPLVSENGRLWFFPLTAYAERLQGSYTAEAWEAACQTARELPLMLLPGNGFAAEEKTPEGPIHWCAARCTIYLVNESPRPRTVSLQLTARTPESAASSLSIDCPLFSARLELQEGKAAFGRTFVLPPGKFKVRFASDAPLHRVPGDPRDLVFQLVNLSLAEDGQTARANR